jgi:HAT1-interacting factor 1
MSMLYHASIRRGIHGEVATQLAPLLLPYGKALFEVACRQTGVLGKADTGAEEPEEKGMFDELSGKVCRRTPLFTSVFTIGPTGKAAQFTFEGDEDDDEEEQPEEGAAEGGEGEGAAAEGDDDDFTVAWEVLDLARTLFEKQDLHLVARDLGETYAVLGDVSLETGGSALFGCDPS